MKFYKQTAIYFSCVLMLCTIYSLSGVEASPQSLSLDEKLDKVVQRAEKAGIEADQLQMLINRAEQKGLSEKQIAALIRPAAELAEQNLPGEIIIQKAFEGLAKSIPPTRIEPVLMNFKSRIQQAEQVVDPWMKRNNTDQEENYITERGNQRSVKNLLIESVAVALSANTSEQQITGLLDHLIANTQKTTLPPQSLATAIQILPDLITTDKDPTLSYKLLNNAVNAGFTASDLNQLPQAMKLARQNSRLPVQAVANRFNRQLESGLTASQIIQNLQVGNVKGEKVPPRLDKKDPKGPDQGNVTDKNKKGNGGK